MRAHFIPGAACSAKSHVSPAGTLAGAFFAAGCSLLDAPAQGAGRLPWAQVTLYHQPVGKDRICLRATNHGASLVRPGGCANITLLQI